MLNIISFFTFAVLAGKFLSKKSYGKEALFMAAICGYMGIMDLLNTYSTLLTNGIFFIVLSFAIKGIVIVSSVMLLKKYNKMAARKRRNVVNVDFSARDTRYRRAS